MCEHALPATRAASVYLGRFRDFRQRFGGGPHLAAVHRKIAECHDAYQPLVAVDNRQTSNLVVAHEDDSVEKAAIIMSDYQVRRLPVVNRDKRLVGIVALGDFAVDSSEIRPTAKALTEISKPG